MSNSKRRKRLEGSGVIRSQLYSDITGYFNSSTKI